MMRWSTGAFALAAPPYPSWKGLCWLCACCQNSYGGLTSAVLAMQHIPQGIGTHHINPPPLAQFSGLQD